MKVIKEVNKNKTYVDKNGKVRFTTYYYLECDGGKRIYIKPVFDNAYAQLNFVADLRIVDKSDE